MSGPSSEKVDSGDRRDPGWEVCEEVRVRDDGDTKDEGGIFADVPPRFGSVANKIAAAGFTTSRVKCSAWDQQIHLIFTHTTKGDVV